MTINQWVSFCSRCVLWCCSPLAVPFLPLPRSSSLQPITRGAFHTSSLRWSWPNRADLAPCRLPAAPVRRQGSTRSAIPPGGFLLGSGRPLQGRLCHGTRRTRGLTRGGARLQARGGQGKCWGAAGAALRPDTAEGGCGHRPSARAGPFGLGMICERISLTLHRRAQILTCGIVRPELLHLLPAYETRQRGTRRLGWVHGAVLRAGRQPASHGPAAGPPAPGRSDSPSFFPLGNPFFRGT